MVSSTMTLPGRIGFLSVRSRLSSQTVGAGFFLVPSRIPTAKRLQAAGLTMRAAGLTMRVSSVALVDETKPQDLATVDDGVISKEDILACPVCYQRLTLIGPPISLNTMSGSTLKCKTCKKTYLGNETHFELIAASGLKEYSESMSITTEFFRHPLMSYVYERGWRQGFSTIGGYPGPEQEFEMMKEYLQPVLGGNIIDVSCGSGPFTRLFAKSGLFSQVIALDYSENMLLECHEFIKKDEGCVPKSSIDAVHAGAALHCWPSPLAGVAEVSRVLCSGGVFIATTAIVDGPYSLLPFLKTFQTNMYQISGSHIFLSESEFEDLCESCGLIVIKCVRNRGFAMIVATKPT